VVGLQTLRSHPPSFSSSSSTSTSKDDSAWRAQQPGWEERVSVQEDEAGRAFEDRLWVPAAASPPVARFLLALAAALGRAARARDGFPSPAPAPTATALLTLLERLRIALVTAAREAVIAAYAPPHLRPEAMGEAAVLQAILDVTLLRKWLGPEAGGGAPASWLARPREALLATVDPINYEAVEPFLQEAARRYTQGCALLVAHLCREQGGAALGLGSSGGGGGGGGLSLSRSSLGGSACLSASRQNDDTRGGTGAQHSSQAMPLVPPVPRFTLLPVVVEATTPASTRLSPQHQQRVAAAAAAAAGAAAAGGEAGAAGKVGMGAGGGGFFSFTDLLPGGAQAAVAAAAAGGAGLGGGDGSPALASAAASSAAAAVGSAASTVISSIFGGASQAGGVASSFLRR
jgi:hypothetical protein